MSWNQFDDGKTIGLKGSENGKTLLDEEHELGARITLEEVNSRTENYFVINKDGRISHPKSTLLSENYFAVACGIYGWFFHTHFVSPETTARNTYEEMKAELDRIVRMISIIGEDNEENMADVSDEISEFVDKFP